jgi:periplasmic copper chaperone A
MKLEGLLVVGVLALIVAGCVALPVASSPQGSAQGGGAAKIQAVDAWTRAGAAEMGNGAAYMILRNSGDTADRLVKAESDVAGAVELHKSSMEGGVMKMAPVENIEVPAKGQAELKPGGLHVMLIGLKRELKAGEKVRLKLQFEKAGMQEIEAEVRKP